MLAAHGRKVGSLKYQEGKVHSSLSSHVLVHNPSTTSIRRLASDSFESSSESKSLTGSVPADILTAETDARVDNSEKSISGTGLRGIDLDELVESELSNERHGDKGGVVAVGDNGGSIMKGVGRYSQA